MLNELPHEGEHISVIGCGSQHDLSVPESVFHCFRHVVPGQVADGHLRAAQFLQLRRHEFGRLFRMAVHRGVEYSNTLGFHTVGGPGVVQVQVVAEILIQYRSMQRADDLDIQGRSLLQHCLYLGAVLAHDTEVIPAGFAGPSFFILRVQCAELAEGVRGEQHLVCAVIGEHDFWPVNHGRGHKCQHMAAQFQLVPFLHHNTTTGIVRTCEVLHHRKGLGCRNHLGFRIGFHEGCDTGGMIRLHVLDDQIVRLPAFQRRCQVAQPLLHKVPVSRIHHGHLFVQDHIGIISHTFRHDVHSLKQVDLMIIYPDITDILCHIHLTFSSRFQSYIILPQVLTPDNCYH